MKSNFNRTCICRRNQNIDWLVDWSIVAKYQMSIISVISMTRKGLKQLIMGYVGTKCNTEMCFQLWLRQTKEETTDMVRKLNLSTGYQWSLRIKVGVMVLNATYDDISTISWRSALLVNETRSTRVKPPTCRKPLTNVII